MIGVPGRSNAFAISERLGMSHDVIERAQQLVSGENRSFEHVLETLEESRAAYETKTKEAEELKREADKAREKAQSYKDSIEELRQKELEKARQQSERIIEQAKRSAYALMNELEELKKQSDKSADKADLVRRAKQQMRRAMGEFDDITNPVVAQLDPDEPYELPRPLQLGDEVLVADMGKTATVTALADKKGEIEVTAGIIKLRTPLSNLRLQDKKEKPKPAGRSVPKKNTTEFHVAGGQRNECDLRGMNVEEGMLELDRHIDRCMRQGLEELTVIHGKGTGVLRKGIQDYLRKNKYVKSYRLGTYGEGESGVTIVTLK